MSQTRKWIGRRLCGLVPFGALVLAVTACAQVEPPEAPPPTLETAALQAEAASEPPEPALNEPLPEPEEIAPRLGEEEVETGGASLQPTLQPSVQPASSEIERLIQVAEAGDASAQAELGLRYLRGRDVSNDPKRALNWSLKAARQGNAEAQSNVGFMYITGSGTQKNEIEAARWWQEAARQGLPQATFNLGTLYENGHGVPRDYEQAAEWYRLAGAQGYAQAKDRLERLYTRGVATRPH